MPLASAAARAIFPAMSACGIRPVVWCALVCLSAGEPVRATADSPGIEFFEKKIRPVLVDQCYKCHSRDSDKVRGGLLLDTREGLLNGGDTGPALVPGDPDNSLLIKAVRYNDDDMVMPPRQGGNDRKLPPEQIADLEAWVRMGAPDPRVAGETFEPETIAAKASKHWAFQPVKSPALPSVKNKRWVQTPVDAFVLARLEAHDIGPSPRTDKRTLIRRATFDLTGLPPTPEEVDAFLADKSPDAFAMVVERLLGSPRYGERWARHWLDVARYADTKGYVFEEERRYPYAYTYRDYVIRAFNEDLPYDQFVIEQIAADLLPLGEDKRPLAALGFLTLGRRFLNNAHDIIDDRIDVVTRGTMGLTVACARCHDHKYDPVPTSDYYSLYGVFSSSTEPDEKPLLGVTEQSKAREEFEAERERRVAERKKYRADKEAEYAAKLRQQSGDYLLAAAEAQALSAKSEIDALAHNRKLEPTVLHRWIAHLEKAKKEAHPVFAPWFEFAALDEDEFATKAADVSARLAKQDSTSQNALVTQALAESTPASLKDVAERYGKLLNEVDKRLKEAGSAASDDADAEALRQVLYAPGAPASLEGGEFDRIFDVPTKQHLRALQRKIEELDATHPGAPPRAMALVDKPKPSNAHVFVRGNAGNRGPEVPRQFLEIITGPQRQPFTNGSGRLELAQAIVSRDNPLAARVMVNRIWLHHFGSALVSTPSDFGLRSDPPTHPDLLDFLAADFMDNGWSVKRLHRLILLSSAYQQSSDDHGRHANVDPANALLWRMNRQRLDFEAMRDTLLAVSGQLDLKMGGHAVDIIAQPFSARRTVYGYIDRQNLPGVFRAFDFANPDATSPQRFFTTVPQQALFLMNSPFVIEQARNLVARSESSGARSDSERVRFMYQHAFQREPTREELQLARDFREQQSTLHAPVPTASVWQHGYGEFDEESKRVKHFAVLPHFTGSAFQGGAALPDPKLGWVMLNENGGHVGNDLQHAAIRRWVAPRDGAITISGTLSHGVYHGDGVRGRIVSSAQGELGQWHVHNGRAETTVKRVRVQSGDTIDFVADCFKTVSHDSFDWAPQIRFVTREGAPAPKTREWSAKKDFQDAARQQHRPLDDWEKYAQTLLLANELVFVD